MPKRPSVRQPVLVVCCGRADRGDEALGPLCARLLGSRGISCRLIAGSASELLDVWPLAHKVIVVEAISTGRLAAGHLHRWTLDSPSFLPDAARSSAGGAGLSHAIRLGRMLQCLPSELILAGIEASGFEWGASLSPPVAAQLEALADAVENEWRASLGPAAPRAQASSGRRSRVA